MTHDGLSKARGELRRMQAAHSMLPQAMSCLAKYRQLEETEDPQVVRRAGFKYNRDLELRRIDLAEALAKRVDPGSFEEPARFAMLAYAAASLQLALPPEMEQRRPPDFWSRFVIGTVPSDAVDAGYGLDTGSGYSLIYISSALVDMLIHAARAVAAATEVPAPAGVSAREEFDRPLPANSKAADRLYGALEAYIYHGLPRAFPEEMIEPESLPLRVLVVLSLRWVVAHEYGHGFAAQWGNEDIIKAPRKEEHFSDLAASIHAAYSAVRLDGLPPEWGVIGGIFFLACHDILHRAASIARTGEELPDQGGPQHPSDQHRAETLVTAFAAMVQYSSSKSGIDINIRNKSESPDPKDPEMLLYRQRAFGHARTLFRIWSDVRSRLQADFKAGRKIL